MLKKSYLFLGLCLVANINAQEQNSHEGILLDSPAQVELLENQDYSGLLEGVKLAAQLGSGEPVMVDIADLKKIAPEVGAEIDLVRTEILAKMEQQERDQKRHEILTMIAVGLLAGAFVLFVKHYKK